jgi:putative ABC transport system permease protein
MVNDLRLALRSLLRQPVFTLTAIATFAVGIGATTAIFSTVNAALLRPLPYPQAQDIVVVGTAMTDGRPTSGKVSPLEYLRIADPALSTVRAAAGTPSFDATVVGRDGSPAAISVSGVAEGFFELFGLPMAMGRTFTPEEHLPIAGPNGPPPSVVISYGLWQELYGGDPAIATRSLNVLEFNGDIPIVGVAARGFDTPPGTDVWFNFRMDAKGSADGTALGSQSHNLDVYLRMKPGTRLERMQTELANVIGILARQFPSMADKRVFTSHTLVQSIVGDLSATLIIVLAASTLLLVLACVNVTNLLLARGAVRTREIAVRVALGAGRGRIVRQLLTESVVLASAGTVAGLALAYASVKLLLAFGASDLPRLDTVPFDAVVLLFAVVVTLVCGLLVGCAPALRLAGADISRLMNDGGRGASGGRSQHRLLGSMIVSEIALAIVLVAGAGWLVRSFANQQNTNPGFVSEGRLAASVLVPFAKYQGPDKLAAWSAAVSERLRGIPGVKSIGSTVILPLRKPVPALGSQYVGFPDEPADPNNPHMAHTISVSPGFFDAMGIRLIAGRAFNADDRRDAPAVTIVNRTFLRQHLSGRDPLTTSFATGYPVVDPKTMMTIVGVVDDVKYGSMAEAAKPIYYRPDAQMPYWFQHIVVTTGLADPSAIASQVRGAFAAVDPQLLVRMDTVPQIVSASLALQRLGMTLMLIFAGTALVLAAIGIYGVIAYSSEQRVREVATRMALGATPRNVFWLIMNQGRALSAAGTLLGIVVALAAGRIVASQLYEVRASDPVILVSASVLVLGITFLAVIIPAGRASRVSPARLLRLE